MIGRAGSVVDMAISVADLLSMAGAGWIGDLLGLRLAYLLGGAMMVIGALVSWVLLRVPAGSITAAEDLEAKAIATA